MNQVKIFGERNTGTNYLKELLRRNFNVSIIEGVPTLNYMRLNKLLFFIPKQKVIDFYFSNYSKSSLGWKHSCPNKKLICGDGRYINDDLGLLFLSKNPYAWLLSMYKRPHHFDGKIESMDFIEFLKHPWPTLGRDNVSKPLKNIIDVYNIKYRAYLDFVEKQNNCLLLRYEDLILNTEISIFKISQNLNLSLNEKFSNVNKSMKRDKEKNFDFYQDFYGNERWRAKLDIESVSHINNNLDHRLIKDLGYEIISKI